MKRVTVALAFLVCSLAAAQQPVRETTYDWACCEDQACTVFTAHQRYDTALFTCLSKGHAQYWIQGGRYRGVASAQSVPSQALLWSQEGADIVGFRLHYGPSPDLLFQVRQINDASVLAYWPKDLPTGTYYFALTAFTADGRISALSEVVKRTVP